MARHGASLPSGTVVAGHQIEGVLGSGASARVYLVRDPRKQLVAMKVRQVGQAELDRRFLREFESIRRLRVPGVVRVFAAGISDQLTWYTMELVRGVNLRRWIADGETLAARVERACSVGARLCDTMAHIHQAGLVHRDLKPSNVLVTEAGEVRVLDFGVVHWWAREANLTREGGLVGTPSFMAPEQVGGLPMSGRADIFAAALMLYEGVAGKRPRPPTPHGWLMIQSLDRVTPLACRFPEVPRSFSGVLERSLRYEPTDRPDAAQLGELLRACQDGVAPADWPEPALFASRESDLSLLDEAMQGRGERMVVLSGTAGSGRSRLLEQARRRAMLRGVRSIRGRCRVDVPGGAIEELLAQLLGVEAESDLRDLVGEDAPILLQMWPSLPLQAVADDIGDAASRRQVVRAAADVLIRASARAPLTLVIHDLEEVDPVSARVLDSALRHGDARLIILATLDPRWQSRRSTRLVEGAAERDQAVVVPMRPLDPGAATAIARSLVPEGTEISTRATTPQLAVEAGLRCLAELRGESFDDLDSGAARLGIVDRPLPEAVLRAFCGDIDHLVQAGFVSRGADELYRVAGATFQKAALARLGDRAMAHDALADAWAAEGGNDPRVWLELAKNRVRGAGGLPGWEAAVQAALAAERSGRFTEARNWLLLLDTMDKDRRSAAYLRLRFPLAACRARVSNVTNAERPRQDLVEAAAHRARTRVDEAETNALWASLTLRQGKLEEGLALATDTAKMYRSIAPGISARLLLEAASAQLDLGRASDALACCAQATELLPRVEDPLLPIDVAAAHAEASLAAGDLKTAEERSKWGLWEAQRADYPFGVASHSQNLGVVLMRTGQRRESEASVRTAWQHFSDHGAIGPAAAAAIKLAALAVGRGEPGPAEHWLSGAMGTVRKLRLHRLLPAALAVQLRIAGLGQDPDTAERARQEYESLDRAEMGWLMADMHYQRLCGRRDEVESLAFLGPREGYRGAMAILEVARARLDDGALQDAAEAVRAGYEMANREGLEELKLYARLLAGAVAPRQARGWDQLVAQAMRARWVELFLGVLEFDGRRREALGELVEAADRYRALIRRADDLGHLPYARAGRGRLMRLDGETEAVPR